MNRNRTAVSSLAWIWLVLALQTWGGLGSCSRTAMCPEHGVQATFTGQTRTDSYGERIYGLYTHQYLGAGGRVEQHNFWLTCGCRK